MVEIADSRGPLPELVLSVCEVEWGVRLPQDYREFIGRHNGGCPIPAGFNFRGQSRGSLVARFFEFGAAQENNISRKRKTFIERLPGDLLPIASDPFGNLICIAARGQHYGAIFFWDHERGADEGEAPGYANVTMIAGSFEDFLEGLYAPELTD